MSENYFYITTPIYYVNDEAHIGHAYTTILTDVLTRFHHLFNSKTFFLTGVDEHGQKVQQAAQKLNITPQEHCDRMAPRFKEVWSKLNISYNDFIRTTEERHKQVVKEFWQSIYDKDLIYSDTYEGWYSVREERFVTDKEIEDGTFKKEDLNFIKEKNYFFKMSQYQDWLIEHINSHPEFIQPEHRKNEILGFLKQGLGDLCISRPKSRLNWGIELPFDSDYVLYVWADALTNYISAHLSKSPEELEKWWPNSHHIIGKDILTTHSVYWPTMLKAAGYEPPKTILAHGWWLIDEEKMSKSQGNVVKPLTLIDKYGIDPFRYFLMRDMTLGQDSNFSEVAFIKRLNSDLANDFGNLLNRTMKLLKKNFQSQIPPRGELTESELELEALAKTTVTNAVQLVKEFKIHSAIEETLQLVRRTNKYIDHTQPWKTSKTDLERTGTILYHVLEVLRLSASLLSPVIPQKVDELLAQLSLDQSAISLEWGQLPSGIQTQEAVVLFPRQELEKKKQPQQEAKAPEGTLIDITDFTKIQLRVGEVMEAKKAPDSDRLLLLQVNIGNETRQIVAGIAAHYEPDSLIGKKIIVIVNLKPATIRGLESYGMLLAAKKKKHFTILTVMDDVPAGSKIS